MTDPDPPGKVIKFPRTGDSGKQTTGFVPGDSEDFDKKLAAYKQRMKDHTLAIKIHLTEFIYRTLSPPDDTCITTALLEIGFARQLDLLGEEDAKDLIDRAFRRYVKERRGPLQ
jgi:hypothetical protein